VGHFAIVLDPERFTGRERLVASVAALYEQVVAAADGAAEATLPGWAEESRRRDALAGGLRIDDAIVERLAALEGIAGRALPTD
jgi:LDH2 family malate/lactate/ureidoglycolate dehydrogenase